MNNQTKIPAISTSKLIKTFEVKSSRIPVIKDVTATIWQGEFVVVTGPSGCGKSTLLHVLLGLEPVSYTHLTLPTIYSV